MLKRASDGPYYRGVIGFQQLGASALGGMPAETVVPALRAALKAQDAIVRQTAAKELGEIRPEAKAAAPDLIAALKDQDASVRADAAFALRNIGPEAKAAVPALRVALKDRDENVRQAAAEALRKIKS
jgi:HEAT repeat protein